MAAPVSRNGSSCAPRIFDPARPPEPKYFTRVPDDVLEDTRLTMSDVGVFAELLKCHWTDDKVLKVSQAELAKRCRISERKLRPHLTRFEELGYIARERDRTKWGAPNQITLTYTLRPSLELAPDLPTARGSECTHRTKRSGLVGTKRSGLVGTKRSGPYLLREMEEEREESAAVPAAESPPPVSASPPKNPDPEAERVCILAAEVGGDVSWSLWASRRIALGDSPRAIEAALGEAVNAGKVNQQYAAAIAARYAREGIPETKSSGGVAPYKSGAKRYGIIPGP